MQASKRIQFKIVTIAILLILGVNNTLTGGERIAFKLVGGIPCIEMVVRAEERSVKANMLIDVGLDRKALFLAGMADNLGCEPGTDVELVFNGGVIAGVEYLEADISGIDEFTGRYAVELNDIPVWGVIGARAFGCQKLAIDLQNSTLDYGDDLEIPAGESVPLRTINGSLQFDVEPDSGYIITAELSTSGYQTVVDADCAALAGNEYGIFDKCHIGGFDLKGYTAVQVINSGDGRLDTSDAIIANSFWQNFRLYLDFESSAFVLEDKKMVYSDLSEQKFFNASLDENLEAMLAYFEENPRSRLLVDAGAELCRLAQESSRVDEHLKQVIELLSDGSDVDVSSRVLIEYAENSIQKTEFKTAIQMLEAAKALQLDNGESPYLLARVNSLLGEIALEQGSPDVRKYLLSSLFLRPSDAHTNYLMGKYYYRQRMYLRAWARYLKAALVAEASEDALRDLIEMQQGDFFAEAISLADTSDLIEGMVFDENRKLTDQAKILKYHGGDHIKRAISALEVKDEN